MINAQIDIPKALMPFVSPIFPFIRDEAISYGRAAEILNLKKIELLQLYGNVTF